MRRAGLHTEDDVRPAIRQMRVPTGSWWAPVTRPGYGRPSGLQSLHSLGRSLDRFVTKRPVGRNLWRCEDRAGTAAERPRIAEIGVARAGGPLICIPRTHGVFGTHRAPQFRVLHPTT